jgi:hypothetical protein
MENISDKTIVVGDVHGFFYPLNDFIEEYKPKMIIQLGDLGYWPFFDYCGDPETTEDTPIYFCDGNHEHHLELRKAVENNRLESEKKS